MSNIHPTAIIDPNAKIGQDVQIGPFCIIGPKVSIGDGTILKSHVVIEGRTTIGKNCIFYPFCSIGQNPQDLKFQGEDAEVIIGDDNEFREYVTIQIGTKTGAMKTVVGNGGFFMLGVHIAHDCVVGDKVVFANNATLAGHVEVDDHVTIGGLAAIHQFVRIGAHAMLGGGAIVVDDVIPFGTIYGERAALQGMNLVGMRRRNFTREEIRDVRALYQILFDENSSEPLLDRIELANERYGHHEAAKILLDFVKQDSRRGLCQPRKESNVG